MHLLCGSSRAMKRAHGGWQRRNSMALHRKENKVPLRQSPKCKWIIAKGSWVRNRNNEGQCDRFVKAEKSEEWMARSPVWPDDVIASEMASRHQPMNWRDSTWVQTRSRSGRSRCVKLPMKENNAVHLIDVYGLPHIHSTGRSGSARLWHNKSSSAFALCVTLVYIFALVQRPRFASVAFCLTLLYTTMLINL